LKEVEIDLGMAMFIFLHETPLTKASKEGCLEEVIRLVEDGHDIHQDNEAPMFLACIHGHRKVLTYLIEKGADIHNCNDAVLRCAASCGHTELVEFLLDQGLDIHSENDGVLACALLSNHNETAEFLLKRGASVKVYDYLSSYLASRSGTANKKAMFLTVTPEDTPKCKEKTHLWSVYRKCKSTLDQICTCFNRCPWLG
jgi:hypothetical protein